MSDQINMALLFWYLEKKVTQVQRCTRDVQCGEGGPGAGIFLPPALALAIPCYLFVLNVKTILNAK